MGSEENVQERDVNGQKGASEEVTIELRQEDEEEPVQERGVRKSTRKKREAHVQST